jgi:hypothetical protein
MVLRDAAHPLRFLSLWVKIPPKTNFLAKKMPKIWLDALNVRKSEQNAYFQI